MTNPRALTANIAAIPCNALKKAQEKKRFVLKAETTIIKEAITSTAIKPNLKNVDKFTTSKKYMIKGNKKCRQTVVSLSAFLFSF